MTTRAVKGIQVRALDGPNAGTIYTTSEEVVPTTSAMLAQLEGLIQIAQSDGAEHIHVDADYIGAVVR